MTIVTGITRAGNIVTVDLPTGTARADSPSAPVTSSSSLSGGDHAAAPLGSGDALQAAPQVASAVTEVPGSASNGSISIARGASSDNSGGAADQTQYSAYGWHVVPSAQNQYGEGIGDAAAKVDVAGDFVTDWFVV